MGVFVDEAVRCYLDGWVGGWARSKQIAAPTPTSTGWYLATRNDREFERFVLTRGDERAVRDVLDAVTEPRTAVKFVGDPAQWRPVFPKEWVDEEPGWLMFRTLRPGPLVPVPEGYVSSTDVRDDVVYLQIHTRDGELASWGQAGIADGWVVPDRINTAAEHRRRGLGRALMTGLEQAGVLGGARRAVLSATADGRELYRSLGWQEVGPLVASYYQGHG